MRLSLPVVLVLSLSACSPSAESIRAIARVEARVDACRSLAGWAAVRPPVTGADAQSELDLDLASLDADLWAAPPALVAPAREAVEALGPREGEIAETLRSALEDADALCALAGTRRESPALSKTQRDLDRRVRARLGALKRRLALRALFDNGESGRAAKEEAKEAAEPARAAVGDARHRLRLRVAAIHREVRLARLAAGEREDRELFSRAARYDSEIQYRMGLAHARGLAGRPDLDQAALWLRVAAEQGHPGAQIRLARMLRREQGFTEDHLTAREMRRREGSHSEDHRTARERRRARQKAPRAALGDPGTDPDLDEAAWWLRRAADQGEAVAQYLLGTIYMTTPLDEMPWVTRAADQGHAEAQFRLGQLCSEWPSPCPSSEESRVWFERAAAQGHLLAQETLAGFWEHEGEFTHVEYAWALVSAVRGGLENWPLAEEVATRLSPVAREAGMARARAILRSLPREEALPWADSPTSGVSGLPTPGGSRIGKGKQRHDCYDRWRVPCEPPIEPVDLDWDSAV